MAAVYSHYPAQPAAHTGRLLNTFKVFREAYLVAGAYPEKSIYLLQHLFNNWFLALDLPRLSAAAILMAGALGAVIAVCIKRL